MKRLIYFSAITMTCLIGITCLSSCLNDDEDNVDIVKTIIVEVDSTINSVSDIVSYKRIIENPE